MSDMKKNKTTSSGFFKSSLKIKNKGFSLVSIIAGIGISSIIVMTTSYLMQQTFMWQMNANIQSDIDGQHLIQLHKAKNVDYLIGLLELNDEKRRCLSREQATYAVAGGDCVTAMGGDGWIYVDNYTTKTARGLSIETILKYHANCLFTACTHIEFVVETQPIGLENNAVTATPRESSFNLPSYMFGPTQQFKFDCAQLTGARQIITGIEMSTLDGRCDPLEEVGVCGVGPLRSLDPSLDCHEPIMTPPTPCNWGYSSLGTVAGSVNCKDAVTLPPTSATTSTPTCATGSSQTVCGCSEAELNANTTPLVSSGYVLSMTQPTATPTCDPGVMGVCRSFDCSAAPTITPVTAPACVSRSYSSAMAMRAPASGGGSTRGVWITEKRGEILAYIESLKRNAAVKSVPAMADVTSLESAFNTFSIDRLNAQTTSTLNAAVGTVMGDQSTLKWRFSLTRTSMNGVQVGAASPADGYAAAFYVEVKTPLTNACP